MSNTLSASMEDYLEVISHLISENRVARVKDIAKNLKVSMSSVTGALRNLSEKSLISYEPYGLVMLTSKGEKVAEDVIRRHEVLQDFFVRVLSVKKMDAETTACEMEHSMSQAVLEKLVAFIEFIDVCPRAGQDFINEFRKYSNDSDTHNCNKCVSSCLKRIEMDSKNGEGNSKSNKYLNQLKPGQKGRIKKVIGGGVVSKRLVDMGVTTGSLISVEKIAPLGDPIEIKVRGYHLSLRKDEASLIQIEEVK